jgi:DNA uptake protein ComE-like DNA-binding protein
MRAHLVIALASLLPACANVPAEDVSATDSSLVAEGSPEAIGLLGFLNAPTTTVELLDVKVGLDKRAAANIIAHVIGPDQVRGTKDDNPFDTVAELDAISYVGATAMAKLVAYVEAQGLVPNEMLGGVPVTAAQMTAIMNVANNASLTQLDVDAGLDSRAAKNIVAARPFANPGDLGNVKYVGASAIEHLRDYAPRWTPPVQTCTITLADAPLQAAADFDELLALSSANAEFLSLQITGCPGATSAANHAALVAAIEARVNWGYNGTPPLADVGAVPGDTQYLQALTADHDVVRDQATNGGWVPASTPNGADLYSRLDALVTALTPTEPASDFVELRIDLQADECSQMVIALVDVHTLSVRITHRLPQC